MCAGPLAGFPYHRYTDKQKDMYLILQEPYILNLLFLNQKVLLQLLIFHSTQHFHQYFHQGNVQ